MMAYLRKKIMNEVIGDPRKQKAVAMAVFIKSRLGRDSAIHNYNPNKIQRLTGISSNTFRSYLPLMAEMGLVSFEGKDSEHLVVCRLSSKVRERNIGIGRFSMKTFKDTYRSLRAFLALLIQHRKDYVFRTLQIARNPKRGQKFTAARKAVKRLVRRNILNSPYDEAKELGISYARIAKETGNCIRTAENIVKYAIERKWWKKFTHFNPTYMPGVNRFPVQGYTFTTVNYGFQVSANTYELSRSLSSSL